MNEKINRVVSVIIPLYNQKQFVAAAIESALNQSHQAIEVLVVNDGSSDHPMSVLEKYSGRIKVIHQENRGLAGARNAGIRESSGDYLQFLDADDWLHRDKIGLQLDFLQSQRTAIGYCEILQHVESSGFEYLNYVGPVGDMFSHLYNVWHRYPLPIHSLLIKREMFERFGLFDETLRANEDRFFLSRIAAQGVRFDYFPFIGGVRRLHSQNMTGDAGQMFGYTISYYQKINAELGDAFISNRYHYPARMMMEANLTYLYRTWLYEGVSRRRLRTVRSLLRQNRIACQVAPIPLKYERFKAFRFFARAYLRRWLRRLLFGRWRHRLEGLRK